MNPYIYPLIHQDARTYYNADHSIIKLIEYDKIISTISDYYKIDDIENRTRLRRYALARHMIFWFAINHTKLTLNQIGDRFYMHHASILHGRKMIDEGLEFNKEIQRDVKKLKLIFGL